MKRLLRSIALPALVCSLLFAVGNVRAQAAQLHTANQFVLIEHGATVELILGLKPEAAITTTLIVPVPGRPTASAVRDGAPLFAYLAEATRPALQVEPRYIIGSPPQANLAPTATPLPRSASALPAAQAFAYTVDDPLPLPDWATAHGFAFDPADQAALTAHLDAGGTVMVVRFADALAANALPALHLTYANPPQPIRPAPMAFDLFVLAPGRRTAPSLETLYAGPVNELDPAPPGTLLPLFAANMYLTHLQPAERSAAGVELQAAPNNEPLRRTRIVQEDVYLLERSSTTVGLGLVACLSMLALVGAVAVRRRLDAISPEP